MWAGDDDSTAVHPALASDPAQEAASCLAGPSAAAPGRALDGDEDPEADEIETDRPDFTQNRKTVGRGTIQLESGSAICKDGEYVRRFFVSRNAAPHWCGRDWLELRLSQNFASDRDNLPLGKHKSDVGAQDLVVGVKLALTPQHGVLPEMGMIIHTSVPSGSTAFERDATAGGELAVRLGFTRRWSLSGSTQIYKATDLVPLPTSRGGTRGTIRQNTLSWSWPNRSAWNTK